jgi:hypothetical protein
MKITDIVPESTVDEVRMDPTSFAQAVEQGQSAGVLVGFEFEVCVPKATIKGTVAATTDIEPKTKDDVDDALYYNDAWDIKIGSIYADSARTPEWFDTQFKFQRPYKGFQTAAEAYPVYKNSVLPRVIELYNKLTPNQQKKYSDMAVERIRDENRNFSFNSNRLKDQLEFARMVGYLLYIKNTGELERIGIQMRSIGGRADYWYTFIEWLVDDESAKSHTSRYFDFDPDAVWKDLKLQDPDDDDEDEDDDYTGAAAVLQPAVTAAMERKVQVFNSYHAKNKNLTDWYIEPDGSLTPDNNGDSSAEIVSPPLPAVEAMSALNKFYGLAQQLALYTNDSTGLHINVSIPQQLDVLKLAVFLGDQYVLKYFGREGNDYARSVFKDLSVNAASVEPNVDVKKKKTDVFGRPAQTTRLDVKKLGDMAKNISRAHTASISYNGKYISFRHAGGNYLADLQGIKNAVGRFVRAMIIASDPAAYAQEYQTKLAKLAQGKEKANSADSSQLVNYLRTKGAPALNVSLGAFEAKLATALKYRMSDYGLKDVDVKIIPLATGATVKQIFSAKANRGLAELRVDRTKDERFATYQLIPVTIAGLKIINSANADESLRTIENKHYDDIAYAIVSKTIVPATDPNVQHLLKQVLRAIYKK